MKAEQIIQLIEAVSASELTEFKYEEDGVKLSLKKTTAAQNTGDDKLICQVPIFSQPAVPAPPMMPAAAPAVSPVQPGTPAPAVQPAAPAAAQPVQPEVSEAAKPAGNVVKSPLVGTFYAAPAEDAEPFVKVGDSVKEGQVLAIVEAMKLMNEIESDFTGTVSEILVEKGQAVENGQPLFVIS